MHGSTKHRGTSRLPDWQDMQGLILSSYTHMDQAVYLLFAIEDPALLRRWLARELEYVTSAFKPKQPMSPQTNRPRNVNVAFTSSGLEKLCGNRALSYFSDAFVEGMAGVEHRSRILGDTGESSPDGWTWGGPTTRAVDLLLMIFVGEDDSLDGEIAFVSPPTAAATELARVAARRLKESNGREHFGFADGISQPILAGSEEAERYPESMHITALGEFVLGYPDAAGHIGPEPKVPGCPDFGRNGTYLVLRQLAQDVPGFWKSLADRITVRDHHTETELAAKIVGRWPDGTPLVPYANRDDNEFGFGDDPYGYGCPIGAHIRRANPRDSFENQNVRFVPQNNHRILRRGRSYGPGLESRHDDDAQERGLVFLCLNADIQRQFEFIQHNWINNPAFAGLHNERDPLVGDHTQALDGRGRFTVPALPAPQRVDGLGRYVRVVGGSYFFLPGLRALQSLSY